MTDAVVKFFIYDVATEFEKIMEKFIMLIITTSYFFYVRYKKCKNEEFDDFIIFLDKLEWFLLRQMEVLANDIEKDVMQMNKKSIADKSESKF